MGLSPVGMHRSEEMIEAGEPWGAELQCDITDPFLL
jgi:hypothetical protein